MLFFPVLLIFGLAVGYFVSGRGAWAVLAIPLPFAIAVVAVGDADAGAWLVIVSAVSLPLIAVGVLAGQTLARRRSRPKAVTPPS